jgi:hypothetical protein
MNPTKSLPLAIFLASLATSACLAQNPGTPQDHGLVPQSRTFYANTNYYNGGGTEAPGVAIAANGNVLLGWEDDGGGMYDFEAVWTLFDGIGNMLTPGTLQTNRDISGAGEDPPFPTTYLTISNTFLSFFRSDDTPIPPYTGWGPKIKANMFGNGIGMGASPWQIGLEIPEILAINSDDGGGDDFPCVQLLNNDGTPLRPGVISGMNNLGIVSMSDADIQPLGAVRIADWDYLANGNILIVGESRQAADRALTGQTGGNVPVYRIVTPAGAQVKGYTAASSTAVRGDMWHGAAVTANGFALRWDNGTGGTIRLFDNAGTPTTANISLATLTGNAQAGTGGRGGGVGFHGNGTDAYVCVAPGSGGSGPWVTVLNANGTVRWSHKVADDSDPINNTSETDVDGAIGLDGRVIAVWASPLTNNANSSIVVNTVQARLFDAAGRAVGSRFVVSEWETPDNPLMVNHSYSPRVVWRGNEAAVTWVSENPPANPLGANPVLAARVFALATAPYGLSISRSGGNVTVTWSGGGTLYSAVNVTGPWSLAALDSPVTLPASGTAKFFRVKAW